MSFSSFLKPNFVFVSFAGGLWGLITGLVVGLICMVTEAAYGMGSCLAASDCPKIIYGVHSLYFAVILFLVSSLVVLGIFLIMKSISDAHMSNEE